MAEYIDRGDLVLWLNKKSCEYSMNDVAPIGWTLCGLVNELATFPNADVLERKSGKWIIKDNPGTGWYRVTCSACGEDVTSTAPVIGFFPNAKITWNYCPECGSYNGGADDVL